MKDKNGKKIFEGDVTKHQFIFTTEFYEIGYSGSSFYHREIGKQETYGTSFDDVEYGMDSENMEVIGNIHDNPELLEVQHEEKRK